MIKSESTYEVTDWKKMYGEGWTGEIIPQAMSHPAKFSRSLIRNIYRHAIEEGWIEAGSTVIDPFGGVGLGALDAMFFGVNWIGVELEPRFVDLGGQDRQCPGFSKDEWKRYHLRGGRINYSREFRWCPDCLNALMEKPKKEYRKARMIGQEIPYCEAHVWRGNIGLWNERYGKKLNRWGSATLLRGDSRKLLGVIHEAGMAVSSPPYADIAQSGGTEGLKRHGTGLTQNEACFAEYGQSPNNLGRLKADDELYEAAISSPPFLAQSGGTNVTSKDGPLSDARLLARHSAGNAAAEGYGDDSANLGNMPHGEIDAAISSPPFKGQSADGGWQMLGKYAEQGKLTVNQVKGNPSKLYPSWNKDRDTSYGHTEGQLADMPDGDVDMAVSSPPYAETLQTGNDKPRESDRQHRINIGRNPDSPGSFNLHDYGSTEGQLGALKSGDLDAAISSPPYAETRIDGNGDEGASGLRNENGTYLRGSEGWEKRKELGARYGNAEGNLGNLKAGEIDSAVSSPPFAGTDVSHNLSDSNQEKFSHVGSIQHGHNDEYGQAEGQLGNSEGEDFWSAAKLIVEQVYVALKPGGHAIWVTKRFVKSGEIVDFSDQWRRLCEAVGFKTVHWHRAMLVEEKGTQLDMFGNAVTKTVERKSFFRRLAEAKGSPRIDWEDILCMVKVEDKE